MTARLRVASLACLALSACSRSPEPPAPSPPPPSLTAAQLAEAEYGLLFEDGTRVKLHDGRFVRGGDTPLTVTMFPRFAFGDLDEDGDLDAAVILQIDGGGSGTFYELAAVLDDGGAPRWASSVSLGDRIDVESLRIEGGDVEVKFLGHGPDDPLCCPTQETVRDYALSEDGLVDVTRPGGPAPTTL